MWAFGTTIFLGAFLLFQVEPLIGKYILPWFGGASAIWTTCLMFFQCALFVGYLYAHLLSRLAPRRQVIIHCVALLSSLLFLPIIPQAAWRPAEQSWPTLRILELLTATLGVPFLVLSATSPLLQQWLTRMRPGGMPYRFYALANLGSLVALLTFPTAFEPHLSRQFLAHLWSWGLILYVLCCFVCAMAMWRSPATTDKKPSVTIVDQGGKPGPLDRFFWIALPACATTLLAAITSRICQDVAAIPFLWILPLAVYLLTLIICFEYSRCYARLPFTLAFIAGTTGLCWLLFHTSAVGVALQLTIYLSALFVGCMLCHGELYRRRPVTSHLTQFYLLLAAGGLLGGAFAAVVAPLIFNDYYELHWGLWACAALFVLSWATDSAPTSPDSPPPLTQLRPSWLGAVRSALKPRNEWRVLGCTLPVLALFALDRFLAEFGQEPGQPANVLFTMLRWTVWGLGAVLVISWVAQGKLRRFSHWRGLAVAWMVFGLAGLGITLWMQALKSGGGVVSIGRNFYGVLTIYERQAELPNEHHLLLRHGRITHGLQFVDPERARRGTAYYGPQSGIGLLLSNLPARPVRLGVVGLGVGTLATYCRPGDTLRVYELDPEVEQLARTRFTYLANCPAKFELVLGDARLSLEREPAQQFDCLVLDAFSSDAIPVHLLTREAFALYQRHLKRDGTIAIHISNHYLNLEPVVANIAGHFHFTVGIVDQEAVTDCPWIYPSTWALLTQQTNWFNSQSLSAAIAPCTNRAPAVPLWTDDFASLFPLLK